MTSPSSPVELFERFQVRGHALAHRLNYSPELVNEAIAILRASFGDDWLRTPDKALKNLPFGLGRHPVRDGLGLAGETQIIDILELCHYLKTVPGATAAIVIANLKAVFGDTIPQLAFAYRLMTAGTTNVHLEPSAAAGLSGDIGFEWSGRPFIAECYAPTVARRGDHVNEELRLTRDIMPFFEGRSDVVSVAIKLAAPLVPAQRKALAHAVYEAIKTPLKAARLIEIDGATISVAPSRWVGPNENSRLVTHAGFPAAGQPDSFTRVSYVPRETAFSLLGRPPVGETGSHLAVWFDDETRAGNSLKKPLGPELERLATKTERKLRQTKREDGPGRLLIVRSWIAHEFQRADAGSIAELKRRLVDQHERVAGVLVVGRSWKARDARNRYLVHPVVAQERPGADLCLAVRDQEVTLFVPPACS